MAKKVSVSEYNRLLRQYNQKAKQHNQRVKRQIDNYNREVKKVNAANKKAVDDYNRAARQYNAEQLRRKQQYDMAVRRLTSTPQTTQIHYRTTKIYTSSTDLYQSYDRLLHDVESSSTNLTNNDLYTRYPQQETTNSTELCNALNGYYSQDISSDFLGQSKIEVSLSSVSHDLSNRWKGALFSLNHNNPDASRHFCSSVREILSELINIKAPDKDVWTAYPDCDLHNSKPNRRSKVTYILSKRSVFMQSMVDFVEKDVNDVINLFFELNSGTHGRAGKLNVQQLIRLKKRVEDALQFILNF